MIANCLGKNEKGHLTIGGCDVKDLAQQYGTPLYVMDEGKIRETCRMYRDSFRKYYGGRGMPLYASKAFSCKEICRIVNEEELGLDVVSAGELYTALQAGFPAEKIHFHGNNKTPAEISYALDCSVGHFVVDNLTELELLDHLAGEKGCKARVLLRVKPGVDAHTHKFIRTGQIDSKFGFALETGEALTAAKEAAKAENLEFCGVHCHIGSQIFDVAPFVLAAEIMVGFIDQIRKETGITLEELNLGGGFGIKYVQEDTPPQYDAYMHAVSDAVHSKCKEYGLPVPYIFIEPGRSIVGEAGITVYHVGSVKEIPGVRTYVSIDGGMGDNPRYALYQSSYTVVAADKMDEPCTKEVTVAGKCCESGDLIQENVMLPELKPGDLLAVLSTGAYNYSMASNYNRIPRPAVVMIKDGQPRVIIRRESFEDLVKNDV